MAAPSVDEVAKLVRTFSAITIEEAPALPPGYIVAADAEGNKLAVWSPTLRVWSAPLSNDNFTRLLIASEQYREALELVGATR